MVTVDEIVNVSFPYFCVHKIKPLPSLEQFSSFNLAVYAVCTLFSRLIGN